MRIVLISRKGPSLTAISGIGKRSLLLSHPDPHDIARRWCLGSRGLTLVDEGIADLDPATEADLVGLTVITGTARRAYQVAGELRKRGIAVVLGGPHVTLVPDDAAPHADAIVTGYAEDSWPELLRDFAAGRMRNRYDQRPDLSLAGRPFARRELLPRKRFLTNDVFEATRGCVHTCEFCVVPSAWGTRPLQKPVEDVVEDIRRKGSRKLIFVDLNLIADPGYARRLFEALIPLRVQWYGLSTALIARDRELLDLAARSGCRGLLIGLESVSGRNLRSMRKGFHAPAEYGELVANLHRHGIAIGRVFGLDEDRRRRAPRPRSRRAETKQPRCP
jgi:radical SAM superfamily enzyme YgiQ (UPF0313 family)